MRVWAFPSFYPYDYPGLKLSGIFAHRQYKGLIENGADLQVLNPVPWYPMYPFSELFADWKKLRKVRLPRHRIYDGIQVHHPRIANVHPSRLMKKPLHERYADSVVQFFRDSKIKPHRSTDIFYSQWLPDSVNVQYAAHRLGLKSAILSIGDDVVLWPKNEKNLPVFQKLYREADLRFACSDYLGREANSIMGAHLPYDVVMWGVDYNFFKPVSLAEKQCYRAKYGLPENRLVILNIGTAIVRKGWLDLLDALKVLKENGHDFVLAAVHAGHPDIDLDAEAQKRDLSERLTNLGEISPSQLNEVFNTADIFCLPSHWEGLANVNIEAMSSGLPVITTNVCGHPELITNNKNGILVNPKAPNEIYDSLLHLIQDDHFRETIAANARDHIINVWGNFKDNASKLYQKFSEVVS
jgi:teichuronic acid biosynthesis glycosyltransferase TuaC